MNNERSQNANLRPVRTKSEARERGQNGGIKSGEVRRAKKDRRERIKELFAMQLTDPKTLEKLQQAGVDTSEIDVETAMDIAQSLKAAREGDVNAYKAMKAEAYGPMTEKTEVELSGEVSGININIRRYDGS